MKKVKELIIKSDPPQVDDFDFEEFLATDDLFVEYFNEYLKLPTFPEPLHFNKETGGFEVLDNAKKDLAQQIKMAVRSSKRPAKIYRPAKYHSFSTIPLIPMEQDTGPTMQEIETSFTVKTLNKEQGIHWIKAERLPSFLKSDCYHEYRLASILSQVKLHNAKGKSVRIKVNHDLRPAKINPADIEPEPEPDITDVLIKDLFVSLGESTPSETQAWVSQAQMVLEMSTTAAMDRPVSAVVTGAARPSSRPFSAISTPGSGKYMRLDGADSPAKTSGIGESVAYTSALSLDGEDQDLVNSKLYTAESFKPHTPRPSENVCEIVDEEKSPRIGSRVYSQPKCADVEKDDDHDSVITENNEHISDVAPPPGTLVFSSFEELGQVVVGTILKSALADMSGYEPENVLENYEILRNCYPENFHDVCVEQLERVAIVEAKEEEDSQEESEAEVEEPKKTDSDHDSLLASDDDYEDEDTFFRQRKPTKMTSLTSKGGIDAFKKFLQGTAGEKYLNFWLDIDRGKLVKERNKQIAWEDAIREQYQRTGGIYELGNEAKQALGLLQSSQWTLQSLTQLQPKVAERLLTYWSPRFLIQQTSQINPDKNPIYFHQRRIKSAQQRAMLSYPYPRTVTKLPLRPKSCQPRIRQVEVDFSAAGQSKPKSPRELPLPVMKPAIPQRRTFTMPTLLHPANRKYLHPAAKEYHAQLKQKEEEANKKEMLTASLTGSQKGTPEGTPKRPMSAAERPKSVVPEDVTLTEKWRPTSAKPSLTGSRTGSAVVDVMPMEPSSRTASEKAVVEDAVPQSGPVSETLVDTTKASAPGSRSGSARPSVNLSRPGSGVLQPSPPSVHGSDGALAPSEQVFLPEPPTEAKPPSRPQSVKSEKLLGKVGGVKTPQSVESVFLGGRRMEGLLEALNSEGNAGKFLRDYIKASNNPLWLNCIDVWQEVQEYHKLFYNKVFDVNLVRKKARSIYSRYTVLTGPNYVQCGVKITCGVKKCLEPPFEELFDGLEEYVISVLHEVFNVLTASDKLTYSKVELVDVTRHLETKNKYVINLQRQGLIKERPVTPDEMEGYKDPEYDPALLERIPEEYRDFTLDKLIHHRIELEHFREFLAENYASTDLLCWMDIEAFRRLPPKDDKKREMKAKDIRVKYLNKKYFFGPNSPAGREGQNKVMEAGGGWGKLLNDRPPTESLMEAQSYVQERLEKKWLPLFLASEKFNERQKAPIKMEDAAEDVIIQRRKKTQHIYKMLESKFVSSSRDIIQFRRGLQNPITSFQFRRFVSIKGDSLENDVLFWQEVQRYKEMYHNHSDDELVRQKIMAIINCFIDSQIPPSLQIDIAPEQAETIIERRRELGPYMFRDAQLTVFRILFNQWNDFCEYRANMADEAIMPTIERQRARVRQKENARLKKEEEKAEREAARRRKLGLPLDSDHDAFHDPFSSLLDDEVSEEGNDDKIAWTYSKYVAALDRDNIISNTDVSTFSSLSDAGSIDGSVINGQGDEKPKAPPKIDDSKAKKSQKNLERKLIDKKFGDKKTSEMPIDENEDKFIVVPGNQTPPRAEPKKRVSFTDQHLQKRPRSASKKDLNDNQVPDRSMQETKVKGSRVKLMAGGK